MVKKWDSEGSALMFSGCSLTFLSNTVYFTMVYTFLLASLQDYLLGDDMVDLCNFHSTLCTTIFVILTNVLSTKFSNYN